MENHFKSVGDIFECISNNGWVSTSTLKNDLMKRFFTQDKEDKWVINVVVLDATPDDIFVKFTDGEIFLTVESTKLTGAFEYCADLYFPFEKEDVTVTLSNGLLQVTVNKPKIKEFTVDVQVQ